MRLFSCYWCLGINVGVCDVAAALLGTTQPQHPRAASWPRGALLPEMKPAESGDDALPVIWVPFY